MPNDTKNAAQPPLLTLEQALAALEAIQRHAQGDYTSCQLFQIAHDGFHAIEAFGARSRRWRGRVWRARKSLAGAEGAGGRGRSGGRRRVH